MGIIAWILLGLIAGVIAKALMPGDDPGGFLWNVLTGNEGYGDLDIGGILIAVLGAMLLLFVYRRFAAGRT